MCAEFSPNLLSDIALVKITFTNYPRLVPPQVVSMTHENPRLIYKIATANSLAAARHSGRYDGMPIDASDGYMHFSTAAQLAETLRLHFKGQPTLVILAIRTSDLGDDLVWEPSRGGQLFPHLYNGPLDMSAVEWEALVSVDADGNCTLPEAVQ